MEILQSMPLLLLFTATASALVPAISAPTPNTLQQQLRTTTTPPPYEPSTSPTPTTTPTPPWQFRLQKRDAANSEDSDSNNSLLYLLTATGISSPYNTELAPLQSAEANLPDYLFTPGHGRTGSPCSTPDECAPTFFCNLTGRTDQAGMNGYCTLQGTVEDSVEDAAEEEILEKAEHIFLH